MGASTHRKHLVSFDGGVAATVRVQRPDRYDQLLCEPEAAVSIPRGAGLSYAPASFVDNGISVEHGAFNRVLELDSARARVKVEAGMTLGELFDFLLPRGFYLPIQPGHGRISVGGCVAADVHGKNQKRDGNFIEQVECIELFHPAHGVLQLSRECAPEIFDLTCGGLGLTGHIVSVELRLQRLPGRLVDIEAVPVANLRSGLRAIEEMAGQADFVYTWHDLMRADAHFGQGFLFRALFATDGQSASIEHAASKARSVPQLTSAGRGRLPFGLLNHRTTQWINAAYRRRIGGRPSPRRVDIRQALFPVESNQFYFHLFGHRGFHEYQLIIAGEFVDEFTRELENYLRTKRIAISLASAKMFGGSPRLLRFNGDGVCVALDFPRDKDSNEVLMFLDALLLRVRGRPNIIKDSRLPRRIVEHTYPEIDIFRKQLRDFDPKRYFRSEISERLGL